MPVILPPGVTVKTIVTGGYHNLMIDTNGTLYSWGQRQWPEEAISSPPMTAIPPSLCRVSAGLRRSRQATAIALRSDSFLVPAIPMCQAIDLTMKRSHS